MSNMDDLLKAILEIKTDSSDENFKPIEQQKTLLESFLEYTATSVPSIRKGDYVQLSDHGKKRYKFPQEGQVGLVVSVYDTLVLDKDGSAVHGEIAVIHKGGQLHIYTLDFRFLKKVLKIAA